LYFCQVSADLLIFREIYAKSKANCAKPAPPDSKKPFCFISLKGMKYLLALIDIILPPRCVLTGEKVDHQGTVSPKAWSELSFIANPLCHVCGFPFDFETDGKSEALCAACLKEAPPYSFARSALVYDDASRDFVLAFKHGDQTHAVVTMIPWLKMAGAEFLGQADVIMPVPLHRWRLLRRRYNQAAIMAQFLGKEAGIKVALDSLRRHRATPTQGHLKANERARNVKSAFSINPKKQDSVRGKKIVLIDDVFTTGSTVKECTQVLLDAGASHVYVLTLARVVKPQRGA
jgi:ComF family protein